MEKSWKIIFLLTFFVFLLFLFMMAKRKTGTREWAESNYNIGVGCAHDCRYCYARASAVRFKQIPSNEAWTQERLKDKMPAVTKKQGWIMFPTTHDITPFYLPAAVDALKKLLVKGNNVLIVSKPHLVCIAELCEQLEQWRSQILFRFTIGAYTEEDAAFWEPGAPIIGERVKCLMYAHEHGFSTSVSMEPMLSPVDQIYYSFVFLAPYVTDKIWIGKMNKIDGRVAKVSPEVVAKCDAVRANQTDEKILWLYEQLKDHPKVAWKDSIQEVLANHSL